MEPNTSSQSFIPQDAGELSNTRVRSPRVGLHELSSVIAMIILLASLALAGAVFLYQQFLGTQLTSKRASLNRAKEEFDPALIAKVTRLDDRMHSASEILRTHIAPTVFLNVLSQVTLSTISFQSLDMKTNNTKNITLKMQGLAHSINSIALQADIFSKNGVIKDPIFSNIDQQADGVRFNLIALINPTSISYGQLLAGISNAPLPSGDSAGAVATSTTAPAPQNPSSPFDAPTPAGQ